MRKVAIVYWNRVEYYGEPAGRSGKAFTSYAENKEDGTFDPFNEEKILKGSGFKRVHEGT